MKKYILLMLLVLFVGACSVIPNNIIRDQKTEKGDWVITPDSSKPVQANVTYYKIEPTWGQSMAYADARADRLVKVILSLVCFIIFVGLFVGRYSDAKWFPEGLYVRDLLFNAILFLSLAASVYFYFGDAAGVRWNNDKWIEKSKYDKAIQETGSTQPIWDSLRNNCLIVDGPYDCYTK